ncbi:hypothetical protein BP5796_10486 [Coleophoma crateriformis]|uniref:alpha-1,2-Mannosidase n=1 Tax=Coleophoma crateriformis TaxID=565419 RepID=A0A3D8QR62_9HELO|nr:hypothetical protein BP5796_10486 [Coleophoma crateriformis]
MLRIPIRLRRYRVFLICAAIVIVALVRFSRTDAWEYSSDGRFDSGDHQATKEQIDRQNPPERQKDNLAEKPNSPKDGDGRPSAVTPGAISSNVVVKTTTSDSFPTLPAVQPTPTLDNTVPRVIIPDRKPQAQVGLYEDEPEEQILYPVNPPGRQEHPVFSQVPTTIRWEKQTEHYPVPTGEIIQLPTGKPLAIPRIQHVFNDETPDAKYNREKRQTKVREEFKRAWNGYRKNAWLHDELSPVSGNFRDPFCGWAATLVDTLDTLWIMGLRDEFEEAAKAVDLIDFTTSPRNDIPLFETTIRYLGGLLAAYDVSEGKYQNLLTKAVELADVLMGAFDTPNRMPVLYYHWKPAFASQPHRASTRANLAELGSLSMEFTRLAQITKEAKYYDAVARITDALSEWQDRGTKLGGVFPDNVDASGCNRTSTVTLPISLDANGHEYHYSHPGKPVGFTPDVPGAVPEPVPKKKATQQQDIAVQIIPGEPSKARIAGWDNEKNSQNSKRDLDSSVPSNDTVAPNQSLPSREAPVSQVGFGNRFQQEAEHCEPQGLISSGTGFGSDTFSMGGGQDSTYEYFTKQHLLLGGLEEKYPKMYKKTANAIRKWMLYRPMLPDNRDVLFSGKVTTRGQPTEDLRLSADVTHLTCFIGGMMGMSAKVFGIDADLEIAKKLTDGCVWAYEATKSGIMPEGAKTVACESTVSCPWNQTIYYLAIDPSGDQRDYVLAEYDKAKAQAVIDDAAKVAAAKAVAASQTSNAADSPGDAAAGNNEQGASSPPILSPIQKRQLGPGGSNAASSVSSQDLSKTTPSESKGKLYDEMSKNTETELDAAPVGFENNVPPTKTIPNESELQVPLEDPFRPLSHQEFVEARIKQLDLPAGFVSVDSAKYILRPEAIESVWYMYRITGEQVWADKGWKMFESIINATSTTLGHSAIYDVLATTPQLRDEMESFWLAETLKYFYLLYSPPDLISLDDWVLNTEAHPFKRPKTSS